MEKEVDKKDLFNMTGQKRVILIGITCAILIAAVLIGGLINIPIERQTYYYTFSTIAQSIIALVAFLGAIVIFRVQLYENKRNALAEKMEGIILDDIMLTKVIAPTLTVDDVLEFAKKKASELTGLPQLRIKKMLDEIDIIDSSSDAIKIRMVDFSIIAICSAIISIVGLFLTPFLNTLTFPGVIGPEKVVSIAGIYLFFTTIFSCVGLLYGLVVILEIFKSVSRKW